MRWIRRTLAIALAWGLLLSLAPMASAQARPTRIIIIRPVPVFYDPFFYGYPYGYPPVYVPAETSGYVKIDTQRKDARIYVDGGYAGLVGKLKKFPLPPGNHNIQLRDSDGRTFYQERVQVIQGRTTKIHFG